MSNINRAKSEDGEDLSYEIEVLRNVQKENGIPNARDFWHAADVAVGAVGANLAEAKDNIDRAHKTNRKLARWLAVAVVALIITWIFVITAG